MEDVGQVYQGHAEVDELWSDTSLVFFTYITSPTEYWRLHGPRRISNDKVPKQSHEDIRQRLSVALKQRPHTAVNTARMR